MEFQKTSEYSIRALLYLARNPSEYISVRDLHSILKIPYKYLTALMTKLSKSGITEVRQGKHGGFRLAKDPKDILVYDIIEEIEGNADMHRCILGLDSCNDDKKCALHAFWADTKNKIGKTIYTKSLQDLINQHPTKI
jgi:Rrf2 family protein